MPRHLTDADYSTPLWLVHNKPNTSPMSVLGTVKEPGDNNVFVITLEQLYALPDQERVVWLFDAEQARKVWLKHTAEPQIDASAVGGKHLAAPRCVGSKRWCVVPEPLVAAARAARSFPTASGQENKHLFQRMHLRVGLTLVPS